MNVFLWGEFVKIFDNFKMLTKFELILWLLSLSVVSASFLLSPDKDWLSLAASIIGVTALIFVAKGLVLGQALTVIFAIFYGIISFLFTYYGEMITYVCMTAPMAVLSMVEWYKNPFKNSNEVKVQSINKKQITIMIILTSIVTFIFFFILKAFGNANLIISTISITTSFLACYLTFLRSPYYALAYAANDIILIILWVLASIKDISYLPMIFCFIMFLLNDVYGFINWRRMKQHQDID